MPEVTGNRWEVTQLHCAVRLAWVLQLLARIACQHSCFMFVFLKWSPFASADFYCHLCWVLEEWVIPKIYVLVPIHCAPHCLCDTELQAAVRIKMLSANIFPLCVNVEMLSSVFQHFFSHALWKCLGVCQAVQVNIPRLNAETSGCLVLTDCGGWNCVYLLIAVPSVLPLSLFSPSAPPFSVALHPT